MAASLSGPKPCPTPPEPETGITITDYVVQQDTGWLVKELPPGFSKIVEGYRTLRGKVAPVAHLVFSDGLAAVSVFIEPLQVITLPLEVSSMLVAT